MSESGSIPNPSPSTKHINSQKEAFLLWITSSILREEDGVTTAGPQESQVRYSLIKNKN